MSNRIKKFELRGEVETNLKHSPPLSATNTTVLVCFQITQTNSAQSWDTGCTVGSATFAGTEEAVSIQTHGAPLLSSAIYSIYYSRYSTPYLSGEGGEGGLVGGGCCGERTRDVVIRRYRTTGIYTFG